MIHLMYQTNYHISFEPKKELWEAYPSPKNPGTMVEIFWLQPSPNSATLSVYIVLRQATHMAEKEY